MLADIDLLPGSPTEDFPCRRRVGGEILLDTVTALLIREVVTPTALPSVRRLTMSSPSHGTKGLLQYVEQRPQLD